MYRITRSKSDGNISVSKVRSALKRLYNRLQLVAMYRMGGLVILASNRLLYLSICINIFICICIELHCIDLYQYLYLYLFAFLCPFHKGGFVRVSSGQWCTFSL